MKVSNVENDCSENDENTYSHTMKSLLQDFTFLRIKHHKEILDFKNPEHELNSRTEYKNHKAKSVFLKKKPQLL